MQMCLIEWTAKDGKPAIRYFESEVEADLASADMRKDRIGLIVKKYLFTMPTEPGHMAEFLNRLVSEKGPD